MLRIKQPNGWRYLRVGGRGQGLGAGKTRSEKNTRKCRRIPHVRCTLCWGALCKTCWLITRTTTIKLTRLLHELYSLARTKKNCDLKKRLLKKDSAKQARTIILENLTLPKNDNAKENEIILQTQLTWNFAIKRHADFESLQNQPRTKTKTTKQSQSKPMLTKTEAEKPWSRF